MATFAFDAADAGGASDVTVRFNGQRTGLAGRPGPGDTFTKDETITGIMPGLGSVSITTWVYGLLAGEWGVQGELVGRSRGDHCSARRNDPRLLSPTRWSWRHWAMIPVPAVPLKTRWTPLAPLASQPAVLPGVYPILALLGIVVALVLQEVILARIGGIEGSAITVSIVALVAGLVGAKVWYARLHPDESSLMGGWAVDGFLIIAPLVASLALLVQKVPVGIYFDTITPGIFFAVALGRVGCFLTGCCAGRPTTSRAGIWSSDRRVGVRRIPTQLLEAGAGLALGLVTLPLVLGQAAPVSGVIFLSAFAAYLLIRQILLRLRVERRKSPRSISLTAGAGALVILLVAILSLTQVAR